MISTNKLSFYILIGLVGLFSCGENKSIKTLEPNPYTDRFPAIKYTFEEEDTLQMVYHIATGDLFSNLRLYSKEHNKATKEEVMLVAGMNYYGPWTRDAAINVSSAGAWLFPEVSNRTMLSIYDQNSKGDTVIWGQYWDKIIWAYGAWELYLIQGDKSFLQKAYKRTVATLRTLEENEFENKTCLFRGAAVYGDGISAYPDRYTLTGNYNGVAWLSNIDKWVEDSANQTKKATQGVGLPLQVLSTNALYYHIYTLLPKMENELGLSISEEWDQKAYAIKAGINKYLWNKKKGTFNYFHDNQGGCDRQEGLGLAFALLFDVADSVQSEQIFKNLYLSKAGVPCIWPSFERYQKNNPHAYGRHSGTVWMHVQGFLAHAAAKHKKPDIMMKEFNSMSAVAWRDKQFREIYHPETTLPYGGLQEDGFKKGLIREWESTHRQTWSAAVYVRTVLNGIFGLRTSEEGLYFSPTITKAWPNLHLKDLRYRNALLSIKIKGKGLKVKSFMLNGKPSEPFLPANSIGEQNIEIEMGS